MNMHSDAQNPPISAALLIDDEQVDQILYNMVIDESGLVQSLMSFRYAQEALDYLQKPDRPEIDVIFLDINMPRRSHRGLGPHMGPPKPAARF
jgi:DNA-binding LytR/AlgR family response regulator